MVIFVEKSEGAKILQPLSFIILRVAPKHFH